MYVRRLTDMENKLLFSLLALFVGPILVLVTSLIYDWSLYGALGTAGVVSFFAIQSVWKRDLASQQGQISSGAAANEMTAREAELIVNAYGKFLEHLGPIPAATVADESKLPFRKEKIKAAILLAIKSTSSSEQRTILKNGFLFLADFQPDVSGPNIGLDLTSVDVNKLDDTALLAMAKNISGDPDNRGQWLGRARAERQVLEQQLSAAGY